MRKISMPLVALALALAACNATPTPAPLPTSAPTTESTLAATEVATEVATQAATDEATTEATSEATTATTPDVTAEATSAITTEVTPGVTADVTAEMTDEATSLATISVTDLASPTATTAAMEMTATMVMTEGAAMNTPMPEATLAPTATATVSATTPLTSSASASRAATAAPESEDAISATSAMASLVDAEGDVFGTAMFTDTGDAVQISVMVSGFITATAGEHGIHVHQVGACTPDFAAAGAHFNPTIHKHGTENPDGPHAGDLENIVFDSAGNATYSTTTTMFAISGTVNAPRPSLLAADGSALVIHMAPDDYMTDPSGRSGGRILCGVLEARGVQAPEASSEPPPAPGGTLNSPATRIATAERIANLAVPAGFTVTVFAQGLDNARMLAENNGFIYVTRRAQGDVIALRDENGDGKAEPFIIATQGLTQVQGIVITGEQVYLGTPTTIYRGTIQDDGTFSDVQEFVTGLPDADQHANAMLGFGPDGNLYVTIGSSCNSCNESNPENAAMLQITPDGSSRTIYAEGLRNTLGWGWNPTTGELWGMDHGSDWRGDEQPPEELNRIEQGNHYGWPHCYGDKQVDRYLAVPPVGLTKAEFCAASTAPVLEYQAHSAPIAMVFSTGTQFPEDYRNGAFIAMRGSWNRSEPTGYKVVYLQFEDGQPTEFSDFLTGFLIENDTAVFGRPAGLLVRSDGALLVTDDTNGMLYQIAYVGTP